MPSPPDYPLHSQETAPAASRPLLAQAKENMGMIPNLERVMASSPPLLQSYVQLWEIFAQSSLNPIEQQVVYQTANYQNNCSYCVPWHTYLSQQAGMDAATIDSLRQGKSLTDPKLEALRAFTEALITQRGNPDPTITQTFHQAGYTAQNALDIIVGLATKLMSNYTNHLAQTPLDPSMQQYHWQKPE